MKFLHCTITMHFIFTPPSCSDLATLAFFTMFSLLARGSLQYVPAPTSLLCILLVNWSLLIRFTYPKQFEKKSFPSIIHIFSHTNSAPHVLIHEYSNSGHSAHTPSHLISITSSLWWYQILYYKTPLHTSPFLQPVFQKAILSHPNLYIWHSPKGFQSLTHFCSHILLWIFIPTWTAYSEFKWAANNWTSR